MRCLCGPAYGLPIRRHYDRQGNIVSSPVLTTPKIHIARERELPRMSLVPAGTVGAWSWIVAFKFGPTDNDWFRERGLASTKEQALKAARYVLAIEFDDHLPEQREETINGKVTYTLFPRT